MKLNLLSKKVASKLSEYTMDDLYVDGMASLHYHLLEYLENIKLEEFKDYLVNACEEELYEDPRGVSKSIFRRRLNKSFIEHVHSEDFVDKIQFLLQVYFRKKLQPDEHKEILEPNKIMGLSFYSLTHKEYTYFLNNYAKSKSIGSDWRKILLKSIQQQLPKLSGTYCQPNKSNFIYNQNTDHKYFRKSAALMKSNDFSAILALTQCVQLYNGIKIGNERFFLQMQGGISADIQIRRSGEWIDRFRKDDAEIYKIKQELLYHQREESNYSDDGFTFSHELYKQIGYANTTINVSVPLGYFILTKSYVFEIRFSASPLLVGANVPQAILQTATSTEKKLEDEESTAREKEEDDDDDGRSVRLSRLY